MTVHLPALHLQHPHEPDSAVDVGGCVWACGISNALTHTTALTTLNFCGPNIINHFYCDFPQPFQLSCSSIQVNELLLFVMCI